MKKIAVGIAGASGYTGSELMRILLKHPGVSVEVVTSESSAGKKFSDIHTAFKGTADMVLEPIQNISKHTLDVVFLALPHGISMQFVKEHARSPFRIIDLSADFRLSSKEVYAKWYKHEHMYPQGMQNAVYGSPELFREKIATAHIVANPGCYVTSAILPLAPLAKNALIDLSRIIVDSKSGVSGAGVKATTTTHFDNVHENFKAYGLKHHRHTIEIQEVISTIAGKAANIQFTPHLLPVDRGILSTIYCIPTRSTSEAELKELFNKQYANEAFVQIVADPPAIKEVRGTNMCRIFVTFDERTNTIIAVSVIDNLVKGASGQAVQNMNIMFGMEETTGLDIPVLYP